MKTLLISALACLAVSALGADGFFEVSPGKKIAYQINDTDCGPKKVVIVPGWSESYLHYSDLLQEFKARKICTYIFDLPEQGLSYRTLDKTKLSHLNSFDEYVDALDGFVKQAVKPKPGEKFTMVTHSTGGLIGLTYLSRSPAPFEKAVMSAPLIRLQTGWVPFPLASGTASILRKLGWGESQVLGQGKWTKDANPFVGNRMTGSPERYKAYLEVYEKYPQTQILGLTNAWANEVVKAGEQVPLFMQRIFTPILILQAENDGFVSNAAQDEFCRMAPSCKKVVMPKSQHGIFIEVDEIRNEALKDMFNWM